MDIIEKLKNTERNKDGAEAAEIIKDLREHLESVYREARKTRRLLEDLTAFMKKAGYGDEK